MATVPINSAVTLTVGTSADTLTNGGNFCPGGKFPRGIVVVQKASDAGTISIRHNQTAVATDPPVPKGGFNAGMAITAEAIQSGGVSVIASEAAQTLYVYPL